MPHMSVNSFLRVWELHVARRASRRRLFVKKVGTLFEVSAEKLFEESIFVVGLIHVVSKMGPILSRIKGFLAGEEPKAALLFIDVPELSESNSFGFIVGGVLVDLLDFNLIDIWTSATSWPVRVASVVLIFAATALNWDWAFFHVVFWAWWLGRICSILQLIRGDDLEILSFFIPACELPCNLTN